jgi:hypothetical protein
MFHIALHFIIPALFAFVFYKNDWLKSWLVLSATMLVDLDHLLANPIYDPNRCSIGFHPLHSYYAIVLYILLLVFKRSRIIGIGLIIHMILDYLDCFY